MARHLPATSPCENHSQDEETCATELRSRAHCIFSVLTTFCAQRCTPQFQTTDEIFMRIFLLEICHLCCTKSIQHLFQSQIKDIFLKGISKFGLFGTFSKSYCCQFQFCIWNWIFVEAFKDKLHIERLFQKILHW